jgi:hypothetical protein
LPATPDLQRLYDDHRAALSRSGGPPVIVSPIVYGYAAGPRTHPARLAPRAVGALSVVQAAVLAGQLMVVLENFAL